MYNTDLPTRAELPSSKQLLLSTVTAAGVAALLLVTTILPAEYGVDPTGVGRTLGLTQMGEIKVSLAQEAAKDAASAPVSAPVAGMLPAPAPVQPVAMTASNPPAQPASKALATVALEAATEAPVAVADGAPQQAANPLQTGQRVFTLKPGAAAEIKLAMREGAKVAYRWRAEGGNLNYDTHGDKPGTDYYGYDKGRNVPSKQGELVAAFDGSHGWFWRNRSGRDVTVTLDVEGDYQSIKRVL